MKNSNSVTIFAHDSGMLSTETEMREQYEAYKANNSLELWFNPELYQGVDLANRHWLDGVCATLFELDLDSTEQAPVIQRLDDKMARVTAVVMDDEGDLIEMSFIVEGIEAGMSDADVYALADEKSLIGIEIQ